MGVMWPDEVAATWLEENAGIPALNNENMKLYIMSEESYEDVCCSEISLDNLRLCVCVSEEGCRKFYYFNSMAHYKYLLQNNDGCPCNAIEEKYCILPGKMINEDIHSGVAFMLELQAIYSQSVASDMYKKTAPSVLAKMNYAS